jgi:hypothetical protein
MLEERLLGVPGRRKEETGQYRVAARAFAVERTLLAASVDTATARTATTGKPLP